jgi:Fic family protein
MPYTVDVTASEILANVDAMAHVVAESSRGQTISVQMLLDLHRRLLPTMSSVGQGGTVRTVQNWIGGNSFNPFRAQFIPPPASDVPDLLEDLVWFCNQDTLPAVAQAAIAHAQFETIHPFEDGNGRTGRALIHVILRRRGLIQRVTPPVSLVLATRSQAYIAGLEAMRYDGTPDSVAAKQGADLWVSTFSGACTQAIADSIEFEGTMDSLQAAWRKKVGKIRRGSATELLLQATIGAPVMTVQSAAVQIRRSFPQTNHAIARLVDAGVLTQVLVGKQRERIFEAKAIIDAFRDLERQMASPLSDTQTSRPERPVPGRKNS